MSEAANGVCLGVSGLTKRFGRKLAVDGVDIQVPEGQVWGFLGPNGSGKTTTIRMLCGLLKPDAGHGTCLGLDLVRQADAIKREVGYMTQRFSYWEDLSIRENLEFVARMYRIPERKKHVLATLERLGLTERQDQLAGELSGGWKQRLALAACMLHTPRLLLLDEPTAGVDPQARREFWEEIHTLSQAGLTVLVSTHYMDEAERCDRIAILDCGHLVATGEPESLRGEIGSDGVTIHCRNPDAVAKGLADLLDRTPQRIGDSLRLELGNDHDIVAKILTEFGPEIHSLEFGKPTLEDVFLAKTGRAFEEENP